MSTRAGARTTYTSPELVVLLEEQVIGTVHQLLTGQYTFTYADAWREASGAYPLSLSMPLAQVTHTDTAIRSYMWGLLPDNDHIIRSWARKYNVSERNPFALLGHVGEDCPGAVQFAFPERIGELQRDAASAKHPLEHVTWLSERELASRLRELRATGGALTRLPNDTGQFSLPGAQAKIALFFDAKGKRWGVPSGRTPTTHIIKPPMRDYDGFVENEHLCLGLARALGFPVADSFVLRVEDEIAIAVERYDRHWSDGAVVRVHQEDFCQALAVMPQNKYESQGGPGAVKIAQVLRQHSSDPQEDVSQFLDALALTWIMANTDAHAKNYSLLLGYNNRVRLAPLYDLGSALPYPAQIDPHEIELAMRIGRAKRLDRITARNWQQLARELHLPMRELQSRLQRLVARIPDAVAATWRAARAERLTHPIVDALEGAILRRAEQCDAMLHIPW